MSCSARARLAGFPRKARARAAWRGRHVRVDCFAPPRHHELGEVAPDSDLGAVGCRRREGHRAGQRRFGRTAPDVCWGGVTDWRQVCRARMASSSHAASSAQEVTGSTSRLTRRAASWMCGSDRRALTHYGVTTISFLTLVTPLADAAASSAIRRSASECTLPCRCTTLSLTLTPIERASRSAILAIAW